MGAEGQNIVWHLFWVVLPVVVATALGQAVSYFASKRRGDEKDRQRAITEAQKVERQIVLFENFPLHAHREDYGPLQVEGIRYPRDKSGDDR